MTGKETYKYKAAEAFHEHAKEYDKWFDGSLVYETEIAALKSLHTEMNDPRLEIGVGPARFGKDLGVAFGVDPAWATLTLASQRGIRCCQAIGENMPVKDRAIGTIYILFTLCFAIDPQKILRECFRILKEDGRLVIGMIPSGSVWGRKLENSKKAGHRLYRYATFYTVDTLKVWLSNANMAISENKSSLYQAPDCVKQIETPRDILDEQAGFVVIVAGKL